jgi:hypothetical protein
MRPAHPHTRNCLVAARNQVFYVHPHIWERCEQHPEVLDYAVLRRRESRDFVVLDEAIGELSAETVNVTSVDMVVEALY